MTRNRTAAVLPLRFSARACRVSAAISLAMLAWLAPSPGRAGDDHHADDASLAKPKPGETQAQAYDRFVEEKLKSTYPATAARMLAECGGIREGICIDLGCGSGHLDVELAKRSQLRIIGLDIDPDMKPLFEKRVRAAGLEKRVSFVQGDAQKLPFADDYADIVVSRGMLIFVPDIGKCLRETDRVLKPSGVAFLGGRYLYAPQKSKIANDALRKIVAESGVPGARLVEGRGQWVKILGPQAPQSAREVQLGPQMLAHRFAADYGIAQGACLVVCRGDGPLEQAVVRGFADVTELRITALYPTAETARKAEARFREAGLGERVSCKSGDVQALPFGESAFDVVAAPGGVPFWQDRAKAFREIHRVLRPGGAALAGGMYRFMPEARKVPTETLRQEALGTGIPSIRVDDDLGQWVEIRKTAK